MSTAAASASSTAGSTAKSTADAVKPAAGEKEAVTMKLTKAQGAVDVLNSSDKGLPLWENMRLYNGYQIHTGEESYAWVSLDNAKLAQVDAVSGVSLRKRGKKLEILLDSGRVFFNVSEPLADDESFNIRTSTIAVGIRGTSGWVEVIDGRRVKICILEGSVTVRVTDPATNEIKEGRVSGGETAVCEVDGQALQGKKCNIRFEGIKKEDVSGLALATVADDPSLAEKIYGGSGLDLRGVTAKEAQEKLAAEAREMRGKQEQVEAAIRKQEAASAINLVWNQRGDETGPALAQGSAPAQGQTAGQTLAQTQGNAQTAPDPNGGAGVGTGAGADTGSEGGSDSGSGGGSDAGSGTGTGTVSGTHGAIQWVYDYGNRTLTLSGSGRMEDGLNQGNYEFPWVNYAIYSAQHIIVEDGITHIGLLAFGGYSGVQDVRLPDSVTSIGSDAFYRCKGSITLPGNLISIGEGAFRESGLQGSVTIPQSVTSIGESAFAGCPLTDIQVAAGNTEYSSEGGVLFSNKGYLGSGDKMTLVCFPMKKSEGQYTIPGSVVEVVAGAFYGCENLIGITIPASATFIMDNFLGCNKLEAIQVDNANTAYSSEDGVWFSKDKKRLIRFPQGKQVTEYEVPMGVEYIDGRAFYGCKKLAKITIPTGITRIDFNAFEQCTNLTEIAIPTSVTQIGSDAFSGCTALRTVTYGGTQSTWDTMVAGKAIFAGIDETQITVNCTGGP